MKETLLDRSYRNFNAAIKNFQARFEDDFYLNLTGYLLQQSSEFSIKHVLEMEGIVYPFSHRIESLILLVPDELKYLFSDIEIFASIITEWWSKTRYIKDFFLVSRQLVLIAPLIKKSIDNVRLTYKDTESKNPVEVLHREVIITESNKSVWV